MHSKRMGKNWMVIKLDMEKAYDRVSWDFISASLLAVGVLDFLKTMIMKAIYSSSMQLLWNEVSTQKFKLVKRIRQGCPLSPYLFVLCMEWLRCIIHAKIDIGKWNPIHLSSSSPTLSHFFADDLVIFCKAKLK